VLNVAEALPMSAGGTDPITALMSAGSAIANPAPEMITGASITG